MDSPSRYAPPPAKSCQRFFYRHLIPYAMAFWRYRCDRNCIDIYSNTLGNIQIAATIFMYGKINDSEFPSLVYTPTPLPLHSA